MICVRHNSEMEKTKEGVLLCRFCEENELEGNNTSRDTVDIMNRNRDVFLHGVEDNFDWENPDHEA